MLVKGATAHNATTTIPIFNQYRACRWPCTIVKHMDETRWLVLKTKYLVSIFWIILCLFISISNIFIQGKIHSVHKLLFHGALSWKITALKREYKILKDSGLIQRQWTLTSLIQAMVYRLLGSKLLPESTLNHCQRDLWLQISVILQSKYAKCNFSVKKM